MCVCLHWNLFCTRVWTVLQMAWQTPGSISPSPTHAQGVCCKLVSGAPRWPGVGSNTVHAPTCLCQPSSVIDADTLPRNRHIRRGHVSGTILLAAVSSKLGGRANAMDLELPSDVDSDFEENAPRSPSPPSLSPPVKKRVLKRPAAKKATAKPAGQAAKKVVVSNMIDMVVTHLGTPEMPADLRAKLVEVKVSEPRHDFAEVFSPPRLTMVVRDYNMVVVIFRAFFMTPNLSAYGRGELSSLARLSDIP